MPRVAREISKTKVYHIILRGNDKQDIFYDEQDYEKFKNNTEYLNIILKLFLKKKKKSRSFISK